MGCIVGGKRARAGGATLPAWGPQDGLFTEHLRACASESWEAAKHHEMTDAIAAGTVPPQVMRKYLIQDHKFLDAFVVLLSSMIASAPALQDRIPGAQFLGLITGKENTYFERSFAALGVTAEDRGEEPLPVTGRFQALMRAAAASGSFARMLAVLIAAEWSYLVWAERVEPARKPDIAFWCGEWIDLHTGEYFGSVVAYLRGLLDTAAPRLPQSELAEARADFVEAMRLEREFWDMAWSAV